MSAYFGWGGKDSSYPHNTETDKTIFPKEMERQFIKQFNESQPNAVHKVIKCHIMRN